jgi:hypothetical protein
MAAQLDAMRAMNKALKPLYSALNDYQKKERISYSGVRWA